MTLPKVFSHRLLGILATTGLIHYNPLKLQKLDSNEAVMLYLTRWVVISSRGMSVYSPPTGREKCQQQLRAGLNLSASTKALPSDEPMYLTSLPAEAWLHIMAKTWHLEFKAALTAETLMLPVAPTKGTFSMMIFKN